MKKLSGVMLLTSTLFGIPASVTGQQAISKSRFLEEAPSKWKQYRLYAKRLQGHREATILGPRTYNLRQTHDIKQNSASALFTEEATFKWEKVDRHSALAFCQNSRYSFRLERNTESTNWVLTGLTLGPDKGTYLKSEPLGEALDKLISPHFYLDGLSFDYLFRQPGFEVRGVSQERTRPEAVLVRVDFSYERRNYPGENDTARYIGWMVLDPELFWCAASVQARYEVNGKAISTLRLEHALTRGQGALPIIKRSTFENTPVSGNAELIRKGVFEFSLTESSNVPETDFTLTAFGLPEPQGIIWNRRPRYYLWFLGLGVTALLIAFLWRRLARREKLTRVPSETAP
jgi:hypothetical protein